MQGLVQRQHADWVASLRTLKDAAACDGALEDSAQADAAAAVAGLALLAGQARGQLLDAILQPLLEVHKSSGSSGAASGMNAICRLQRLRRGH